MKKIKLIIFLFGMVTLFSGGDAFADGFVINLFFNKNTGVLSFDKYAAKNIERDVNAQTSIVEFSKDKTEGSYILKLYDVNSMEISSSEFNTEDGAFRLIIPYFSIAAKMEIIKKSTNEKIISEDISEYMTCNGNGKCDKGENKSNCLGDCSSASSVNSILDQKETRNLSNQNIETKSENNKSIWVRVVDFFKNLF